MLFRSTNPVHALTTLLKLLSSLPKRVGGCQFKLTPAEHALTLHLVSVLDPYVYQGAKALLSPGGSPSSGSQPATPFSGLVYQPTEILDNIMVYWLSNTGASSGRLYWEAKADNTALPIDIAVGVSIFPGDLNYAPREWGERYYKNIVHWRDVERGGHFAAWEVPELFVREVRETFRHVR